MSKFKWPSITDGFNPDAIPGTYYPVDVWIYSRREAYASAVRVYERLRKRVRYSWNGMYEKEAYLEGVRDALYALLYDLEGEKP